MSGVISDGYAYGKTPSTGEMVGSKTTKGVPAPLGPLSSSIKTEQLGLNELMDWLSRQMRATDADLRDQMRTVQNQKEQNKTLGYFKRELSDMTGKLGGDKCAEASDAWKARAADPSAMREEKWYKNLGEAGKKAVDKFVDDINAGGGKVHESRIKVFDEALTDEIGLNNSTNELGMIQLQSAISARGQMIQLVSNMINAMNESAKHCIGNIR